MEEKIEEDLTPGLIVAEEPEPEKTRRPLIVFLLYFALFSAGLAGTLFYKNHSYKIELEEKSSFVPEKISDNTLNSILSENLAYLFNPKISSNLNFYEKMKETADDDIRFLYSALVNLYSEDNNRDAFIVAEKYEEDLSNNNFSVIVHLGFLKSEDSDYHFENLTKEGFFRVESFQDYSSANDHFNQNYKKFSAFKFNFRTANSAVYLIDIENA